MKTSVIVITHPQYQKFEKVALDSLKQQQGQCEVIVHENLEDTLAKACNTAISKAQGEYIVRLDADDFLDPQLVQLEADYLDEHPDIACVWCDYWKTYPTEGDGYEVHHLEWCPQNDLEHACGAMFRKSVWEELGGYTETLERQEAFDFWLRFHQQGYKAAHIAEPLYYYRQHQNSMSTNVERRNQARIDILCS